MQVTVDGTTASMIQVTGKINFDTAGTSPYVFDVESLGLVVGAPYTRTIATATAGIQVSRFPVMPSYTFPASA